MFKLDQLEAHYIILYSRSISRVSHENNENANHDSVTFAATVTLVVMREHKNGQLTEDTHGDIIVTTTMLGHTVNNEH